MQLYSVRAIDLLELFAHSSCPIRTVVVHHDDFELELPAQTMVERNPKSKGM